MAKAKKFNGVAVWVGPEIVAHERSRQATSADELRALIANPPQGEWRERIADGVHGELLQRCVEDGEVVFRVYDGEPQDYQHTVRD